MATLEYMRTVEIHNLIVPATLESRQEEIKQIIAGKHLKKMLYCKPTADGGTGPIPTWLPVKISNLSASNSNKRGNHGIHN